MDRLEEAGGGTTRSGHFRTGTSVGSACQQREPSPPPETIDLGQSGLPHPSQLVLDIGQSVLGVILGPADQIQELSVKLGSRRGNHLQIGKQPVRSELSCHLTEQTLLSLIIEMMDRKTRDHDVKPSERCQRISQVPLPDGDSWFSGESPAGIPEHGWR
jgi:hypothetical protein